ncbi:transposase [Natrialba sp. PRR66]|uniref:transposase n=1 Tax=Natrialba sp. PRR66 TaxID=3098146 RepID=UPI0034E08D59
MPLGVRKSEAFAQPTKSQSDFGTQLHDPSGHAAIDATFFDRENASKHYCRRTNYRVQTLKATALVDTASQAILDGHCTTEKRHDTQRGWRQRLRLDELTRKPPRKRRETVD